jgi:sporulation integral membrane protein YtvI
LESLGGPVRELQAKLLRLAARLPASVAPAAVEWVEKLFEGSSVLLSSLSKWVLDWAGNLLAFVPNLLMFLLTTLLSSYFFAIEDAKITALLHRHLPEQWRRKGSSLWKRLKVSLKGYCKAQLYLSGVSLLLSFAGLLILGKSPLLSIPIAFIDALPVFGAGAVLIPWGIVSLLQGSSFAGWGLLVLYGLISVTRTVLEPRFLGRQIGLHPLLTLLALYAGFRLFGFWGMLLLPVGVMLLKQLYDLSSG